MNNIEYFKNAKFGMMVHWGLYSVLAGEWNGQRIDCIGEWIMSKCHIPIKEYEKYAQAFNPICFDANEWVKLAKDAGMKYIVITAKHHEGFAMYHSKVDSYNIYDATPFKRDPIAELAKACKENDMKLGLYYSQELDWHEKHGGGVSVVCDEWKGTSWSNNWDFPDPSEKDFSICFKNKIIPQVTELLTNYGDIFLFWFDCPTDITREQSMELFNLVKKYQPDCLVNSRIGNKVGDYSSCADNYIPDEFETTPYESPCTLNDTWGYKAFDQNWKPAEKIIKIKNHLNERGINYLLNVGPDYLGRIPEPCIQILRQVGNSDK